MAINVELFDGTILEFPDGTDKSVILATGKRITLERQMAAEKMPRNELGEIVEKDPQGSGFYQDVKRLVDPIRPYVEPVADYFTKPKTSSVLEGTTLGDVSGEQTLPPSTDVKRRTFEAATPDERIALARKDQDYRKLLDFYAAKDQALAEPQFEGYNIPDTRKLIDTRAEKRRERMIAEGVSPETATNVATYAAREGMAGASPLGIARPLNEEELAAETAREEFKPGAAGTLSRIGGKSKQQYKAAVYGGLRFIGDMAEELGADEFGQRLSGGAGQGQKQSEAILKGIGENPNKALNFLESGVSGAINNIAPFLAGPTVGLTVMGTQVFGQEYGQGRDAGLGKTDAVARASAMTTAELIGEAASLPTPIFNAFKKIAEKVPADQIMPEFGRFLIKENLAEQVTTALQFSADKFAPFGIRQDASFQDYLQAAYDTFYQTMAQTLVTGGGAVAAGKAIRMAEKPTQAEFDAQEELRKLNRLPVEAVVPEEAPVVEAPVAPPVQTQSQPLVVSEDESQDRQAMLAELEEERDLDRQLKQVSVQEPVSEEAPPAEPKEKEPEFAKAVNVKDFSPEDKATIRAMEVERNKIGREKKLFPAFLRRQGIQPSEKADLGLEGIRRADIFKKAAPTFDELTSRAISEGFLLSTGDDVQDVENFRQFVSDYIGSGIIGTGPDVAREGQLRAIDDSIQEIVRKYEQPASIELTGQTPDEARAEAEALELQRAEEQRVVSEQQRVEQEARDRAEIARRSEGAAEDFQLGQTAEDNLTGQKDIFAEQEVGVPESRDVTGKQASWVIKNKQTGEVIMETYDKAKVAALNKGKYKAVPISEHLASLNKRDMGSEAYPFVEPEKKKAPTETSRQAKEIESDARFVWYELSDEERLDLQDYLNSVLEARGEVKTANIPEEIRNKLDTGRLTILNKIFKENPQETISALTPKSSSKKKLTKSDIDAAIEDGINRYSAAMVKNGVKENDTPATMGGRADAALRKVIDNIEAKLKSLGVSTLRDDQGNSELENIIYQKVIPEARRKAFAKPEEEKAALPMAPSQAEAKTKQDEYKARNDRLKEIEDMPSVRLEPVEKGFDSDEYQAAKEVYEEASQEYRQAIKDYVNTGKDKVAFDKVHQKYNDAVKKVNKAIAEGRVDEDPDWDIPFNIERRMAQPPAYAEEVERRPSLRVGMKRLMSQFNAGKIAPETLANRVEFEIEFTKDKKKPQPRERGAFYVKERLNKAARKGQLSAEAVQLAEWFISKNPALLDDLGISIVTPAEDEVASGFYKPSTRIMTLITHSSNDETAVHEILHHLERMLPDKLQEGIRKSWFTSLAKAAKAADKGSDKDLKRFYESLLKYHVEGDRKAMKVAEKLLENGTVDYEHYQHINPSEFWAVNAADIVAGRYAQSKSTAGKLKQWLKELYQKIKSLFRLQSSAPILRALDSLAKADGRFVNDVMIGEATQYMNRKNYKGGQAPLASWQDPQESKLDNWLYKIQDKLIDTKRVQQAITQQAGEIEDNWNAYMKEELYHGRTAKRTQDFLKDELAPIVKELAKAGIEIIEFDQFLHNRHAEERNVQIAKINPNMPDSGSGIATADAQQYMKDLDPAKRKLLEKLANKIDDMVKGTQKILIDSGLEEKSTIDAWNSAYKHYVPLKREDVDFVHTGTGLGQGFATRGGTSARATGSLKNVAEIFANLALQRERAIIRSEKARVGKALYGLAIKNPNPDFWLAVNPDAIKNKAKLEQELVSMGLDPLDAKNLIQEPKQQYIDPRTGLVAYRVNPVLRTSDNVFPVRINGQDRFIFFNSSDERAMRMVSALKNLDADQLGLLMNSVANITRWIASVNTQYNPVFGAINFLRDVQGAALNLTTTPLAGKKKEIVKNTFPALKGIYSELRGGKGGMWADLWEDYQEAGGQTGYRDQFSRNRKQASIVEREMGAMKRGRVKRAAYSVAQWLSDYNDSMENAVRLSAYKSALDMGLSKDKAASIAKNLTVNFNRKGANAQTVGALYAFFNASVQGTTRLVETMRGPAGRKIFYGGVALGTLQAVALAVAGFDDDEPPEFIKSRNLIIPTGGKSYIAIPMPLGFNLFPNLGRLTTEFVISGGKKPVDKTLDLVSTVFNTFNPIGGSGLQLVAPTIVDPVAALYTNVDAFGRPISKEDRKTAPTPGYSRSREQASTVNKYIAEFLNYASGGTKYQKGAISPTADQLDYLVGQATGGVGRETMKAVGAVKALATGEELPSYKVPLAGKFYGNTESPANIASKFYDNVTQLANYENEIKGRRKNRENVGEFLREHPEARLYERANRLENQITQLNRTKKELQERKAPKSQIEALDKRKTMLMDKFNQDYKKASK